MIKLIIKDDCGNSPKQKIILDLLIAGVNEEYSKFFEQLTDDIELSIIGYANAKGKDEVMTQLLKDSQQSKIAELTIENILSHGNKCTANGLMKFNDDGIVAFNNLYIFENFSKSAKIKEIKIYSIVLK